VKREIKSEIVTVRLTPSERRRLDELGGAAKVLRRALQPPAGQVVPHTTSGLAPNRHLFIEAGTFLPVGAGMVWQDGTVGHSWPALASA